MLARFARRIPNRRRTARKHRVPAGPAELCPDDRGDQAEDRVRETDYDCGECGYGKVWESVVEVGRSVGLDQFGGLRPIRSLGMFSVANALNLLAHR